MISSLMNEFIIESDTLPAFGMFLPIISSSLFIKNVCCYDYIIEHVSSPATLFGHFFNWHIAAEDPSKC